MGTFGTADPDSGFVEDDDIVAGGLFQGEAKM